MQLVSKEIWVIGGQLLAGSVSVVGHGCPALSGCKKDSVDTKKKFMADRQSRLAGRDKLGRFEELEKAKEKKSSTVEHLPLPGYGDAEKDK